MTQSFSRTIASCHAATLVCSLSAGGKAVAGEDRSHGYQTFGGVGRPIGEGYFSPDGSKIIYQSEATPDPSAPENHNPFYQMYVKDLRRSNRPRLSGLRSNDMRLDSPFWNTRSFFLNARAPAEDVESKRQAELERRRTGGHRPYAWEFDATLTSTKPI